MNRQPTTLINTICISLPI